LSVADVVAGPQRDAVSGAAGYLISNDKQQVVVPALVARFSRFQGVVVREYEDVNTGCLGLGNDLFNRSRPV